MDAVANNHTTLDFLRQPSPGVDQTRDKTTRRATTLSLLANVTLFAVKLWGFILSGSKSVLASLADSAVDIASQLVIYICYRRAKHVDPRYPVGKARLETVGTIISACIMALSAVEVIQVSGAEVVKAISTGGTPELEIGFWVFGILGGAIGLKAALFLYCRSHRAVSDTVLVLAEDHWNDVISNTAAVVAAAISSRNRDRLWWVDPTGGIMISLYIIYSWVKLAMKQIDQIVGRSAPDSFIEGVKALANAHDGDMEVDVIRAYHFGHQYFVELEVVFPPHKTVAESHDVAVHLQQKVEALQRVERAFVHVDYQKRDAPEHNIDWSRTSLLGDHFNPRAPCG
ncbi:unnamed protein product [Ostreobium quekettii]|uniref:Cation efflux protein cytoplasmic domain-containing protein n=1 Tax=Ostreobium quekettii TaxID=121088 RepID=A0A8S1IKR5_9CHLO|nr:unnamed protein product [Ostreobium quekettii]|eukprot:evm.model.scf_1058.6 EVM.evm.TU.scf_1058.6   scf_1058:38379-41025(-)